MTPIKLRKKAVETSDKEISLEVDKKYFADYCSSLVMVHFELKRFLKRVIDLFCDTTLRLEDRIKSADSREKANSEIVLAVNEAINKAFQLCSQKLASVCQKYKKVKDV
ncbi:MAG: hypothetical protein A2W03_00070 [Candidatus Aminicenantes bacterium RBG_16_63_16]|nr:MAG: hypothetical protein A2W03_00070 [Candidatus Aminicenantes bacterium RBG_16_63_16]